MSQEKRTRRAPSRTRLPSADELDRERRALDLRRSRVTYDDIARQVGYASASGAYKAVHRALGRVAQPGVEEYRREELDMLDALHHAHWTRALAGDIAAAKIVLSTSERRAKLLGLDAAVAIRATVTDALDAEIEELVRELAEIGAVATDRQVEGEDERHE